MRRRPFAHSLLALAMALAVAVVLGVREGRKTSRIVAVIDTGIGDELKESFAKDGERIAGWNLFDDNADVRDEDGHGTRVARAVLRACASCRLVPLKITKHGAGARPDDLARALELAESAGASVAVVALGLTSTSPALDLRLARAARGRPLVVAAAGQGVPNPFRGVALSTLWPQGHSSAVVVGALAEGGKADPSANFGVELDLVVSGDGAVIGLPSGPLSSSLAAGLVGGAVAGAAGEDAAAAIRHRLRAWTEAPRDFDPDRLGFGALRADQLLGEALPSARSRAVLRIRGDGLDLSADHEIARVSFAWDCPGARESEGGVRSLAKGRVFTRLPVPAPGCREAIARVRTSSGEEMEARAAASP